MSRFELGEVVVWGDQTYVVEALCDEPTVGLRGPHGRPMVAASTCRSATPDEIVKAFREFLSLHGGPDGS